MGLRALQRRWVTWWVTWLIVWGLVLHGVVFTLQLSSALASSLSAVDGLPAMLCHADGTQPDGSPADQKSPDRVCAICWGLATAHMAVLPDAAAIPLPSPGRSLAPTRKDDRPGGALAPQPRSRGPPLSL